jgi:hypothetical protein
VSAYLNKNYPGWKFSVAAKYCTGDFQRSRVTGDFDGDGAADYAVKISTVRKGYIIAFVSHGNEFRAHVLESGPLSEMRQQGLAFAPKGERYGEIINEDLDRADRTLASDAPVGGTCGASSYMYVYSNGSFRRAFTSD